MTKDQNSKPGANGSSSSVQVCEADQPAGLLAYVLVYPVIYSLAFKNKC